MTKKKYIDSRPIIDNPVVSTIIYFVFQGMRYMSWGERVFKLSITCGLTFALNQLGLHLFQALFFAHLINFLFNSQIPVLLRYVVNDPKFTFEKLEVALEKLRHIRGKTCVAEIFIYGSFARGAMSSTSDLDVRLFHNAGIWQSVQAYSVALSVRFWANVNNIPIDLFCFSDPSFLSKLSADEVPAVFSNLGRDAGVITKTQLVDVCLEKITGL